MSINKKGLKRMKRRGVTIYVKPVDIGFQQKNGFVEVPNGTKEDFNKVNADDMKRIANHFKADFKKDDTKEAVKKSIEAAIESDEDKHDHATGKALLEIVGDLMFVKKQSEEE